MGSYKETPFAVHGSLSVTMELSDNKCVICCSVLRESVRTSCGHRFCRECMRENGPRRCPVHNEPLLESERRNGGQGCVTSNNIPPVEPPAGQSGNDEQGVELSLPDKDGEQNLSQGLQDGDERQPTYQQGDDSQGNASSYLVTTGGRESEISYSIPAVEEVAVAGHCLSAPEQQPVYQWQANDDQGDGMSHQMAIQESFASQLVNGQQQQPHYQQSAQADALTYPMEEMGLDGSLMRGREELRYPIQETGSSAERTRDLPPCHHQLNGADINAVSSTGQTEQAVEHNCSRRELQLWKQKLDRAEPQKATRDKINPRKTFFILDVTEVRQRRQADISGEPIAFFSSAIHTDSYEYKLGIRAYLNGAENESGRYVAIFVNMMMGKYDNIEVRWPFTQRITLSILDQSGAKRHISQSMQAKPNLSAFQKPTEAISCTGCGFVKFAPIEEVFSPHNQYVKDDKLLLKIEFSY